MPHGRVYPDGLPATDLAFAHELVAGSRVGAHTIEVDDATTQIQFRRVKKVFAGDVHMPQTLRLNNRAQTEWVYVGAPSHIDFSKFYKPQFIIYNTVSGHAQPIIIPPEACPRKRTLRIKSQDDIEAAFEDKPKGEMYRVILDLPPEEIDQTGMITDRLMTAGEAAGVDIRAVEVLVDRDQSKEIAPEMDDREIFNEFCHIENVPPGRKQVGEELMT